VFTADAQAFLEEPGRRWLVKPVERAALIAAVTAVTAA
jgi:hypothetical protein